MMRCHGIDSSMALLYHPKSVLPLTREMLLGTLEIGLPLSTTPFGNCGNTGERAAGSSLGGRWQVYAARCCQVVQRPEGVWLHHPGRRVEGCVCPLLGNRRDRKSTR